ncbi:quinolinate phosphoribosyltransferase [Echinococcus multilocularis]|uniref:Quinolinate phosphoribosyltransferase [decarboxylating] n=1 Tax=Echinococcus multilocularis TaxID=6211 RepID=A0A087W169_ECHMU|nr:quinolinate phosphoribosyltransferase [Echinococcus multilocularis]
MHSVSRRSAKLLVSSWLSEESSYSLPGYDLESSKTVLVITMKTSGVLAGVPFLDALAEHLGCAIEWHVKEGEMLPNGSVRVASMTGATADLVHSELLIKNILSRASGIATFASRLKRLLADFSWGGELVSPFTHTPGFALVEEYAMFVAGVPSSRNLSSVLLPMSHVEAAGGVVNAISAIKAKAGKNTHITVECGSLDEAKAAAEAGASSVRFESLTVKELGSFSAALKSVYSSLIIEASGNFDETTLRQFLVPNVDALTTRKMFSGYPVLDFILSYETGSLTPSTSLHVGSQKRTIATAESEQTPADNGNSNVGEEFGDVDVERIKRFKSEPDSSKRNVGPAKQHNPNSDKSKYTTPGAVKTNERLDGDLVTPAPANTINRKHLQQKSDQNRSQRFDINRHHPNPGNRRLQPHDRNDNRMHNNNNSGLLSSRPTGGIITRNLQSPQQQAANTFLHQARMMAFLSSRQPGVRVGPQPPHQCGLIGSGPTSGQQWSIMGGPPRPPQCCGSGGICCRNCGMQNPPGVPYCRSCRVPIR